MVSCAVSNCDVTRRNNYTFHRSSITMYEGVVCVCCMATNNLVELFSSQTTGGVKWNYAEMIDGCFDIHLSPTEGEDSICGCCIQKLDEAVAFKRLILRTVSLLTSVSMDKLISNPQHLGVLGISQHRIVEDTKVKVEIKTENEATDSDDPESDGDLSRIQETSNNAEEYDDVDENNEAEDCEVETNQQTDQSIENQSLNLRKSKRRRGRPRKYPIIKMPYKIGSSDTKCRECALEFPNNLILKAHYNKHFPNFPCQKCAKSFMNVFCLKKHELTHLAGPFHCDVCKQEFRSINSMHSHKRYKHTARPAYPCTHPRCAERFSTLSRRLKHVAHAHGLTEAYKCERCDMSFQSSSERSKHMMKHRSKVFACPLCEYKSRRCFMRDHLANKHDIGEKKFQCELCPSAFCKKSTLIAHHRSHRDERKFKCRLCCKSFVQKCTLKYHVNTHIKKKEFLGEPTSLMVNVDETHKDDDQLEFLDETLLSDSENEEDILEKWALNEGVNVEADLKVDLLENLNSDEIVEDNSDLDLDDNFLTFIS